MKTASAIACAAMLAASAHADVNLGVDPSSAPWLAYMNVFELPANGGGFVFGSAWGIADLVANFNDGASTLTMSPNTIGDPNEFWYQDPTGSGNPNPGGPGAPGNKIMEANLYQESTGAFNGEMVTFSGTILSNSFTGAHEARVFIRDFAADYSSSVDVFADAVDGNFSVSLATIADSGRHIQWGIQVRGVNVWVTDTAAFGNVVISTVPTPGALAVVGLGGLVASRRRRA
jgi:MYXO-CTERM domain-containing protein